MCAMATSIRSLQRTLSFIQPISRPHHISCFYGFRNEQFHRLNRISFRQSQTETSSDSDEQITNAEDDDDTDALSPTAPIAKKKKKRHTHLSKVERGAIKQVSIKSLYQKYVRDKFLPTPPAAKEGETINAHDTYKMKDKWIDRLVRLQLLEPRGDYKEREKQAMLTKGGVQTNLGNETLGRALHSAEQVKRKYGAKKRAKKEHRFAAVEKYYKVFGGLMVMRHWRIEKWLGIPVKLWIFFYLLIGGMFVVGINWWFITPVEIENNPRIDECEVTEHIPFVIQKLIQHDKVREHLGAVWNPKLSKLQPADRTNFRAKFVHEVWAKSEKEGGVRFVLIYDTEQSMEGLIRLEVHLDHEILKIDFEETEDGQRDFDRLLVVRCPPDLFPLAHWFTQSRREINAYIPYYIWPLAPFMCLVAIARWHYRSPPGLANYVLDQLKSHVIVRRALGSPVHLQSDQWRGRLTQRSCNMRVLLEGSKHTGKVSVVGYRDGSTRWLFPNAVLMIDGVKHDHYREIHVSPFEIPEAAKF